MKSIIRMLLAVFAILSGISSFAYDFEVDGIYYDIISIPDQTCSITYGEKEYVGEFTTPISVSFNNRAFSVTAIGGCAFQNCTNLKKVTIKDNISRISYSAFKDCTELYSIELPNSITTIPEKCFEGCTSLETIVLPANICDIEKSAFSRCNKLKEIVLPNNLERISADCFAGCHSLKSINLPSKVTSIESGAFSPSGLENITFESAYISFDGEKIFKQSNLEELEINIPVYLISYSCLQETTNLKRLNLPNLEYYDVSNNQTPIKNCTKLEYLRIGKSHITYSLLANGSFPNLKTFVIASSTKKINIATSYGEYQSLFSSCKNIEELIVEYDSSELELIKSSSSRTTGIFSNLKSLKLDRYTKDLLWDNFKSLETLTLGPHITNFNIYSLKLDYPNIKELNLQSPTVVNPTSTTFNNNHYMNLVVNVPNTLLEEYQKTEPWKYFWNLKGTDFPEIQTNLTAITNNSKVEIARYDIMGNPISKEYKGIVIIRYSDGSTKKEIIK